MSLGLGIGMFGLRGTDAPITGSTAVIPSLDLRFAQDQAFTVDAANPGACLITAIKGPAANFSRLSGATQVGADGLIEYAPENLLTDSQNVGSVLWSQNNVTVASDTIITPDGTLAADTFRETAVNADHNLGKIGISVSPSGVLTVSAYVKAGLRTEVWLRLQSNGFANGFDAKFDLATGTTSGFANFGDGVGSVQSITPLENGWFKITATGVPSTSGSSVNVVLFTALSGTVTYMGVVADALHVWGFQLERHPSARTYLPTTSAPVYGPRFDYDPVTLECKGLLIEEQRTNFALASGDIAGTSWTNFATITTTQAAAEASPVGGIVALLEFGADIEGQRYCLSVDPVIRPHTFSVWAKSPSGTQPFQLRIFDGGSIFDSVVFTATTDWTRFEFTANSYFQLGAIKNGSASAGQLLVVGAQFEAGSSASSYIPTTAAAVTRSADVCSISGADFASFYNQDEGTVVSRTSAVVDADDKMIYSIDNGSYAQRVQALLLDSHINLFSANVTDQVNENIAGLLVDTALAVSMKLNDWGLCMNGGPIIADASAAMPVVSDLKIGRDAFGNSPFNGHIARLTYYPKRLSDAKIQTLTAP